MCDVVCAHVWVYAQAHILMSEEYYPAPHQSPSLNLCETSSYGAPGHPRFYPWPTGLQAHVLPRPAFHMGSGDLNSRPRRLVLPSGPHFHLWLPMVGKGPPPPQLKLSGNKSDALVCFHGDSRSNQADSENYLRR